MSISGAFQRNSIYAKDIDDANGKRKKAFKNICTSKGWHNLY